METATDLDALCEVALEASPAEATEVLVHAGVSALTRYANNAIHQNVWEADAAISIRAVYGQRIGVCSTNDPGPAALREAVQQAARLARVAPEHPGFPGLIYSPPPTAGPAPAAASVASSPEERQAAVSQVLAVAEAEGLSASGALSVGVMSLAVANSAGTRASGSFSRAEMSSVMQSEDSSGRAEAHSADVSLLDPARLARVSADKALRSRAPRAVDPGEWTVILEPDAVADMIFWLGLYGFNALAYQEKRSFLCEKLGQKLCDSRLSLWDDGLDPRGLPQTFDFEGVPKQPVDLLREGVAVGMVHDTRTAAQADPPTASTGHALPAPNPWGPVPTNLFLSTGDTSLEQMIASTARGLLVTRFHYTNMVHPVHTVFTGMTRDGTFLIEDGEIAGGVKNLRFTQSILEALDAVEQIGDTGVQCEYAWVPALKLARFHFTGATEF